MKKLNIITVFLAVSFVGCTTNQICFPPTPEWEDQGTVSQSQVFYESLNLFGKIPAVSDSSFAIVDFDFAMEMLNWANKARFALLTDKGASYVANSWDCETRAAALNLGFSRAAAVAGVKAKPLVAIIDVLQKKSWANVPAGGAHAVLLIYTNKGVIVIESQNSTWCFFKDYPNKDEIFNIDLKG